MFTFQNTFVEKIIYGKKLTFTYFCCHVCPIEMSQNNICVVRIFSVPPIFGLYNGDFSLQPNRSE